MSYLFPLGDTANIGVLQVGSNITVDANSIISIPQSIATTAAVTFDTVNATTALKLNGNSVVTGVTPTAGTGISVTGLTSTGPASAFTINNTGVTSLIAGTNVTLSGSTGAVTISVVEPGIEQTTSTATAYTASATDGYIGVTANPTTVTLPLGVTGKVYIIKNESSGTTTVTGTGSDKIDGSNNKTLSANASMTVIFRAGWRVI
ncbi:hypothetical protein UFOVP71_323 [uncultured Caudovirales phage]|uniref:Uncharacterized protein n=1 Tax=uncultured Caudovirales phage TaxID=2100421 RepID=A0A6J5TA21_9CAUD|nr:hypothetical protein UFOVP71_323 [uncultured Caudovirales phage]